MWKLPFLIALVSLALATLGVLGTQFVLLRLGVSEAVTNALALVVGLGAIVLAEWQVRRWWLRRH
jgi:hypothetical protein